VLGDEVNKLINNHSRQYRRVLPSIGASLAEDADGERDESADDRIDEETGAQPPQRSHRQSQRDHQNAEVVQRITDSPPPSCRMVSAAEFLVEWIVQRHEYPVQV
jgi:hypothetical protein